MDKLLELAERCEKASGPDRELDFWIGTRIEGTENTDEELQADIDQLGIEGMYIPAAYTASLDAAMTLVPEGWHVDLRGVNASWSAYINDTRFGQNDRCDSFAATPALALCAAALRARAALNDGGSNG